MRHWLADTVALLRRNPSAVLLITQLVGVLLYALIDESSPRSVGRLALSLFGMLVVVLALGVVRATPTNTWLAIFIGVPAVIATIIDWATGGETGWHLTSDLLHVAFYTYTLIGLLRYLFHDERVTADEIWGIGATFTVGIWLWAYAYSAIQTVVPGSFIAAVDPEAQRTWVELLFLSTTTMTSTGLSDVVPVTPLARAVVMIQQIGGMLYLAVAVSRIVGLTVGRVRQREAEQR